MSRCPKVVLLAVVCSLPSPAPAAEQTGEIRGTVADQTGAVLPHVRVTTQSPSLQGPEGRGGRTTPAHAYLDLAVDKQIKLTKRLTLDVGVNVYNLFNSQTPVSYVKEDTELFGEVWGRQLPRWAQIRMRVAF